MLTPGTMIGGYEIVSAIGAGGMGEVYRARDQRLKRDGALKVLPPQFTSDPERLARFQREAEVLATLNHPNIAQVHGLEVASGVRALVMETHPTGNAFSSSRTKWVRRRRRSPCSRAGGWRPDPCPSAVGAADDGPRRPRAKFADQESEDASARWRCRSTTATCVCRRYGHLRYASRVPIKELRSRYLPVLMETANEISRALGADVPRRKGS